MDFDTGKLRDVSVHLRPSLRREYFVFWTFLLLTSIPYLIGIAWKPLETIILMLFLAYFQVLVTLATSSGTATSHYMRFLLSGSNPIGMTGGSSLLFGAVDAVFDWEEDASQRRQHPWLFYAQLLTKFALTPIGLILLLLEFLWDLAMLRHPRLLRLKWHELFSLSEYHDIICPEKSNDVFYADLAISQYSNDPHLYQWNRMRSMVFELQQYLNDTKQGTGTPESNLFLQTDVAAYQSLKRLRVEEIEEELRSFYDAQIDAFPFPPSLAKSMLRNARPTIHYERMFCELQSNSLLPPHDSQDLRTLLTDSFAWTESSWKVLRLLDSAEPFTPASTSRVSQSDLNTMAAKGILERQSDFEFRFAPEFTQQFEGWFHRYYVVATTKSQKEATLARIPDFFVYQGKPYVRRQPDGVISTLS